MDGDRSVRDAAAERERLTAAVTASVIASLAGRRQFDEPFRHWTVAEVFPPASAAALRRLPFPTVHLGGVSGKRELYNDERHYFDAANNARLAECAAVAAAFQSPDVVEAIEANTGANLSASFVRLEYAQDTDGFWLAPHTDLGVKRFTMLIYLADGAGQGDLGTDLYADPGTWAKRTAFADNSALIFVPCDATWHGLARRPIAGVRKSVIMNYVTADWRERGQLAYPDQPVRA
ncbi:MAG: 2OG-Fe(II) oxygenase [Caulobacteraceae bacterium]